jgi:myo-inositol-1-phosphate synthase
VSENIPIENPAGKLGVMMPGLGAVATTFIAGISAIKRGLSQPYGSLTQMGTIRLGKRTEKRTPKIKDFVKLVELDDLVFGGWDIFTDNVYKAALNAGVLRKELLDQVRDDIEGITPWKAVFDQNYVKKLQGEHVKSAPTKYDLALMLMEDIQAFKDKNDLSRMVMVWCASTEVFMKPAPVHETVESFEKAMKENHPAIAPSMIYAYASLSSGVPFANGAPNLTVDIPAMFELAAEKNVPILAPGFKARLIGLNGWFSTNILGNRDGEVLDDPESFKTKEESKLGVLEYILQPDVYPDLYKDLYHKVRINYYPPRGDNKEGWDNIDIFGWLGYPMQIKIDFLCRDSILAAPIVLDLALFLDLAQRSGMKGIQEWLSFYFKSPMCAPELYPEHDLFIQLMKLKNTLRHLRGEELITHLGLEYYD